MIVEVMSLLDQVLFDFDVAMNRQHLMLSVPRDFDRKHDLHKYIPVTIQQTDNNERHF